MTPQRTRPIPARRTVSREAVGEFSAEKVKAPLLLRAGAAMIDYMIVAACPVLFLILSNFFGNDGSALINSELNNMGWLLAVLLAVSNLLLLPVIAGRTAGKFITGLTVVGSDGRHAGVKAMLMRQTVGYLLVLLSGGITLLVAVFDRKGRALHDFLSGTVVIFAEKRTRIANR